MRPELNPDSFRRQIRAAHNRVETLRQRASGAPDETSDVLTEAFEEFRVTLEELRVAEAELQQQNEELLETRAEVEAERQRYRDLFDFAPDGYLVTDLNGVIREANVAAVSMLGTTLRALNGKPLVVFVPEAHRAAFRTFVSGLPAKDREAEWEMRLRPRVGETFWCAVTVATVRDAAGAPSGLRWLLRDITSRKRAEAQLRVLNAELEQRVQERTASLTLLTEQQGEWLRREQEARQRAEAHERDLALLADAGAVLSESLDYATTLARVGQLALRHLADWCVVDILEDGAPRRMVVAHRDPARQEAARRLQDRYAADVNAPPGPSEALRTGRTVALSDVPEETLRATADGEEPFALLRELGVRAVVSVPLVARGHALGVLTLVASGESRRFGRDEVAVAEELGRRAAMAVENARLYHRVRAELAQRAAAEEALARREREVSDLNRRLQRAMRETHHRVKNNLQLITGLVDLSLGDAGETVATEELRRISGQVRLLARVHDMLTQPAEGEAAVLPSAAILDSVLAMLKLQAQGRRVVSTLDSLDLPARQATSLALIAHELVSNALKHSAGEVEVTLKLSQQAPGNGAEPPPLTAVLQVCDNGAGFPPGFEPAAAANVGLELVESLGRWDLDGEVFFESRPKGGGRVSVTFPVAQGGGVSEAA